MTRRRFDTRRVAIETIFLDAGGVLVWPNWSRVAETLAAHGVHVDAATLAAADARARAAIDRQDFVASSDDRRRGWTLFELVLTEAGVDLSEQALAALADLDTYHRAENLWEHVPTFVRPALVDLRRAGYRLVVVSNSNGTLHQLLERVGIAPLLDIVFDSHVEKVEKPDRRFFELALARSGSRADATVHVGDLYYVDVTGARSAGLDAVLVDEADLRPDVDCPRVHDISELRELLFVS